LKSEEEVFNGDVALVGKEDTVFGGLFYLEGGSVRNYKTRLTERRF
jgi:hypothetical protein